MSALRKVLHGVAYDVPSPALYQVAGLPVAIMSLPNVPKPGWYVVIGDAQPMHAEPFATFDEAARTLHRCLVRAVGGIAQVLT